MHHCLVTVMLLSIFRYTYAFFVVARFALLSVFRFTCTVMFSGSPALTSVFRFTCTVVRFARLAVFRSTCIFCIFSQVYLQFYLFSDAPSLSYVFSHKVKGPNKEIDTGAGFFLEEDEVENTHSKITQELGQWTR